MCAAGHPERASATLDQMLQPMEAGGEMLLGESLSRTL